MRDCRFILGVLVLGIAGCGASAPEPAPAATRPAAARGDADYASHMTGVREMLATKAPQGAFTVLVEKPFVVVGDGG